MGERRSLVRKIAVFLQIFQMGTVHLSPEFLNHVCKLESLIDTSLNTN